MQSAVALRPGEAGASLFGAESLRRVAELSGARAFSAQDAGQLGAIYKALGSQLGSKRQTRDVTTARRPPSGN